MAVEHHPPEELLVAHAAGTAEEAVSLVVACHATLCPRCRATLAELDELGGALVDRDPAPAFAADEAWIERTIARAEAHRPPSEPDAVESPVLPRPLLRYSGPFEQLRWRTVLPGVRVVDLPLRLGTVPARLKLVRRGLGVPPHGHRGVELDLILAGGLRDLTRGGLYERGDLQHGDPAVEHALRITDDEDCLVLSVNEARMRPLGLRSRLLHFLMGF